MRSEKINYVIVGSFVLAMLVGLVIVIALLTGRTGAMDRYFVVFDNVTGVKFGTQVLYEGYPVGQVEEIVPFEKDGRVLFRVELSIIEGWKIPEDSVAEISASGLLSAITIAISAGPSQVALKPGDRIPSRPTSNMFAAIQSVAAQISDLTETGLKPLLHNIDRAVGSFADLMEGEGTQLMREMLEVADMVKTRTPTLLDQMQQATNQMATLASEENVANARAVLENAATLTKDLNATRSSLDHLISAMDTLIADNRLDVDKTVVDLRYTAGSIARHIDAINQNLEDASRNMYEFSRQIRQNPGLLLGGTPPKDEVAK
jgi:phospholipid/cholesterol/gamma-HCH transport system substrate-binding protein